jgi:hypothetical protein
MASDPKLVGRLSAILAERRGIEQRAMFGGVAYLLNGNMCVGVHKDWLIARAGERGAATLLERAHVRPVDITGKPMKGWIMVGPDGLKKRADLVRYVDAALSFVEGLPAK